MADYAVRLPAFPPPLQHSSLSSLPLPFIAQRQRQDIVASQCPITLDNRSRQILSSRLPTVSRMPMSRNHGVLDERPNVERGVGGTYSVHEHLDNELASADVTTSFPHTPIMSKVAQPSICGKGSI